jgi:hypothetical protein
MANKEKSLQDILNDCPPVPKYTPLDDIAFNDQYNKCVQMINMLYEHVITSKGKLVTSKSIKIIDEDIGKFYILSQNVIKTKEVLLKINYVDQFKKIVGIINSNNGLMMLKKLYETINVANNTPSLPIP